MAPERTEPEWLAIVRSGMLHGDLTSAQAALTEALDQHPGSVELRRAQAGVFQQAGRGAEAEAVLCALLDDSPGDAAAAFSVARIVKEQGRTAAAARILRNCFDAARNRGDANLAITAIEWLDDCDRKRDAAAIAEAAINANPADPRLHAYAGMLAIQLGEFQRARERYLFALAHDPRAHEWHVPIGLASTLCYADSSHPDFALFADGLQRDDLSELARAELHFALGKANDDVRDYAEAAHHFREGNAIRQRLAKWSRKRWRRAVAARLASPIHSARLEPAQGFTPVFIVGMPRSGTTLLAERLARYPGVCNRGELKALANIAEKSGQIGAPTRAILQNAAESYAGQSRQDDGSDSRWFLDKQPLNFRYVDLALALFPDAKVIHCQRNARDTALSLWMQCFLEPVHGYSYDFADIAQVMRDCTRLMERWRQRYPESIRAVRYEDLVATPEATVAALAEWVGLSGRDASVEPSSPTSTISTASLWQARQPVHTRSVGRWRNYAGAVPELSRIPDA